MHFEIVNKSITAIECDTLIISVFEGVVVLSGAIAEADKAMVGLITNILAENHSISKFGQATVLYTPTGIKAKQVIVLGLGKMEDFTLGRLREVSAIGVRAASKLLSQSIVILLNTTDTNHFDPVEAGQALAEGVILGSYRFEYYKTGQKLEFSVKKICVLEGDAQKSAQILLGTQIGQKIAQSVNFARDMTNHPSNFMTPTKMAQYAEEIAEQLHLDITILGEAEIEKLNMSAIMAVSKGSDEPARMIVLRYNGAPKDERVISFIGKGITFDSGGISLKRGQGMQKMKDDMAGGAAVLAAAQAIAALKVPINLIAIVPCTENLPSGHAYKPGDVISSLSGRTIEITNTDAEGRLVLADAITYACQLGATKIIDVATLSGACAMALGNVTTGMFGNNQEWKREVSEASLLTGEKMWELPMFDEYSEQIKSEIADIKNSGGWQADAIIGAVFLEKFVDKVPWVHLDIAGTVSCNRNYSCNVKGATGVSVRTLIQLARGLGK
jgi:leucyl aminopeptidase